MEGRRMTKYDSAEWECLRSLSDAIVQFIYDDKLYVDGVRQHTGLATKHPLFQVALDLNNRALGSRLGSA